MLIRGERADDRRAIREVIAAAFSDHPFSNQKEGDLVDALREAGALSLSLVAEDEDAGVIGHLAISPVVIARSRAWYGLGPVAVMPIRQRRGVGRTLIEAGLAGLRAIGAAGCVVLGEPEYYRRFGFERRPELRFEEAPPEFFMALPFGPDIPEGKVDYHPAFALVG
ncbi:MAG: GNAT family N-acetyltransferase [Methylocystaceae bacterium]|nr:MAG: GNAT family N-acetyltransferase [Methylocystaceae bacterium]